MVRHMHKFRLRTEAPCDTQFFMHIKYAATLRNC